jgi:hypothetical protein
VAGLGDGISGLADVCDDPHSFAHALVEALQGIGRGTGEQAQLVRHAFGPGAIQPLLDALDVSRRGVQV